MTNTVLTPREALSALIERATAGEEVTAEELAVANAAVQLEEYRASGEAQRAEEAADKAAAKKREKAKEDAAEILAGDSPEKVVAAYDAAVAALRGLKVAIETRNASIRSIAKLYSAGGVPDGHYWFPEKNAETEFFDDANFAIYESGRLSQVVVNREVVSVDEEVSTWLANAVIAAENEQRGKITKKLAGDLDKAPHVLREYRAAQQAA
ncbi:hypothetical protein ACIGKR_23930 [Rhodococcus qingshengii]|uniref:hypothetical protein n=1 Tax=Rhodococcus qingshengii TaxID=334542 RepID=UPI0037C7885C